MNGSAVRRWTLFASLALLGGAQVAAYVFFTAHSVDFIAANHNARAREFSRAHVLAFPARLRFGTGQPDMQRLGDGWNLPDPGGVWSLDNDAWVELFLPRSTGAIVLRLGVSVYGSNKVPDNRLQLGVNGSTAASWAADELARSVSVAVPGDLTKSGSVELHLHVDRCESPLREGTGSDPRRLGVRLEWIEVLRTDADAADAGRGAERAN